MAALNLTAAVAGGRGANGGSSGVLTHTLPATLLAAGSHKNWAAGFCLPPSSLLLVTRVQGKY